MKSLSVKNVKEISGAYYDACVKYFAKPNNETYFNLVEAEHVCRSAKISSGEISRIRFDAHNYVVNKNGTVTEAN